jgi:hypothetical protein
MGSMRNQSTNANCLWEDASRTGCGGRQEVGPWEWAATRLIFEFLAHSDFGIVGIRHLARSPI